MTSVKPGFRRPLAAQCAVGHHGRKNRTNPSCGCTGRGHRGHPHVCECTRVPWSCCQQLLSPRPFVNPIAVQWNGTVHSSVELQNAVEGNAVTASTDGYNLMVSLDTGAHHRHFTCLDGLVTLCQAAEPLLLPSLFRSPDGHLWSCLHPLNQR